MLNARDVHFYANALGARGKTDRVDAGLIARYAAQHHAKLHAWQPGDGAQKHIQELVGRRATRRLSKRGPAHLRRQLYLSGFAASHSKALKPLYQALCVSGALPQWRHS